ncbi:LysR substrate-binding domain-containing protein [Thalassococcus sp. S3]|uniref:LysR substrate-binding domain-containing protein n=1 Tax=Thalassococcus sp. S3 TaxID=2017482 RepID=UPI0020C3CD98|nr:LysR substrate-binding domain-containing protein [Thalassococcus sp. S3]
MTRQQSRGIQRAASGTAVARKLERLLEDYHAVLAEGADLRQSLSGTLRIGHYAPIAPAFLPGTLATCLPDSNTVDLHLEECDNDGAQKGLLEGCFDIILFVSEDVRPAIGFDVLVKAPSYCLLPAEHSLADQAAMRLEEIAREPLVVLDRPVAATYYTDLFDKQEREARVVAYATSTEMVRNLVGAGLGCAILNMQPRSDTTYSGAQVVARPISDPLPPLTLSIGYDKMRPRALVRHVVDACLAGFRGAGAGKYVISARK